MKSWTKGRADGLMLTGLRMGESKMRDGKLQRKGCSAGGECGIPEPNERTYSPLLKWKVCQVVDWLSGAVRKDVRRVMRGIFRVTFKLIEIYDIRIQQLGFDWGEPDVQASRFGCIGCPAISAQPYAPRAVIARNGPTSPLNELYDVWFEARRKEHRVYGKRGVFGPIRMHVRRELFDRVMDIQRRAGIELITPEDELFIRESWALNRYPRGWSAADEENEPPSDTPLFDVMISHPTSEADDE